MNERAKSKWKAMERFSSKMAIEAIKLGNYEEAAKWITDCRTAKRRKEWHEK